MFGLVLAGVAMDLSGKPALFIVGMAAVVHVLSCWACSRLPIFQSLSIVRQVLAQFPGGVIRAEVGEVPPGRVALGHVEGWRGEIFHWIHTAPGNRLIRCKVKDPSLQNWPALSEAIMGNIIPDFPVVNKSFNLSYSGTDR